MQVLKSKVDTLHTAQYIHRWKIAHEAYQQCSHEQCTLYVRHDALDCVWIGWLGQFQSRSSTLSRGWGEQHLFIACVGSLNAIQGGHSLLINNSSHKSIECGKATAYAIPTNYMAAVKLQ